MTIARTFFWILSRVIERITGNEVTDVKSSGRNKVAVSFKNLSIANRVLDYFLLERPTREIY